MKTLYLIGGPMGVGKSMVCQLLKNKLPYSVFLDGDWCWDSHPFQVTEGTKEMVMKNICYLLNNFIHCSAYEHVFFCWVLHDQRLLNEILFNLDTAGCKVKCVSLVCDPDTLKRLLLADVERGVRQMDVIAISMEQLPLYHRLNTIQMDISSIIAEQAAELLSKL